MSNKAVFLIPVPWGHHKCLPFLFSESPYPPGGVVGVRGQQALSLLWNSAIPWAVCHIQHYLCYLSSWITQYTRIRKIKYVPLLPSKGANISLELYTYIYSIKTATYVVQGIWVECKNIPL